MTERTLRIHACSLATREGEIWAISFPSFPSSPSRTKFQFLVRVAGWVKCPKWATFPFLCHFLSPSSIFLLFPPKTICHWIIVSGIFGESDLRKEKAHFRSHAFMSLWGIDRTGWHSILNRSISHNIFESRLWEEGTHPNTVGSS